MTTSAYSQPYTMSVPIIMFGVGPFLIEKLKQFMFMYMCMYWACTCACTCTGHVDLCVCTPLS